VTEVVRGELQFPAFAGAFEASGDEAGVVDEQVQWAGPCVDEVGHGRSAG
jgi:hypothetical protein